MGWVEQEPKTQKDKESRLPAVSVRFGFGFFSLSLLTKSLLRISRSPKKSFSPSTILTIVAKHAKLPLLLSSSQGKERNHPT